MRRLTLLPIAALALALAAGAGRSDEKDDVAADEARLKAAYLGTDGASLVEFLSTRARGEATRAELQKLIDDLEGGNLVARQKAAARLVSVGAPAVPVLRMAAREIDSPDLSAQARGLLKALEDDPGALSSAAIRLLAARRPPGTAEALLAYLPHAETDAVLEDLRGVLAGVAYEKGRPAQVMLDALSDRHALRRATAVQALCQGGIPEPRAAFRKLLNDPKPSVRLRAALALAKASDPKAVSTLITLLTDVPIDQAKEVEAYLLEMAGDLSPKVPLTDEEAVREKARDVWAKWWLDTEGTGLLDEVRKRTLSEDDLARTQKLVEKLGDDAFEERQKAEDELKKVGPKILPLLKLARTNPDLEVRNRAVKCVEAIEMDKTPPLAATTPRMIALRKPKGAAETVLQYMPFVDDESMADEMQLALNAVGYAGGKADPAVLKAAADKAAARRAAAGVALCAGPLAEHMPLVRKLLADREAVVRGRVALALAGAKEPEAVPALIRAVEDGPADVAERAEDYLTRMARDAAPKDLPDDGKKRAAAWAKWWDESKTTAVMLDRNAPASRVTYLGHTILVKAGNNEVQELDRNNKPVWQITGLLNPWDAQWLPGNRVLVAEYNGNRVTERETKTGTVKWEKGGLPSQPMQAERLKGGNTFIVCRNVLMEVDKSGKEVLKINRPGYDVYTARRLPDGKIVLVTTNRQIIHFDKTGTREEKSFAVPEIHYFQNEILDNGNVLIPLGWRNQVAEYDRNGKKLADLATTQPTHAVRLPSGGTLVLSQNWPNPITEFDKKGKQTSSYNTNAYCFRVRRR
ncbi:MAG: HEAT repeat domain-containing protein [Gemmataceae bacterium]